MKRCRFGLVLICLASGLHDTPCIAQTFESQKLVAPAPDAGAQFGASLSVDDDVLVVAAPFWQPAGQSDPGAMFTFIRQGHYGPFAAEPDGQIDSCGQNNGFFCDARGLTVAMRLPHLAIGRPFQDFDGGSDRGFFGTANLSPDIGGLWGGSMVFTGPPTLPAGSRLGAAIAMGGGWVVGGAPGAPASGGGANRGSALVSKTTPNDLGQTSWESLPIPAGLEAGDMFGAAVAIDDDAGCIIIGAPGDDDRGTDAGAVYVYRFRADSVGEWRFVSKLTASDGQAGDAFGSAIAVASGVAIIGAPFDNLLPIGGDEGSAYVFVRQTTPAGSTQTWTQRQKIVSQLVVLVPSSNFGAAIAMTDHYAVIGAPGWSSSQNAVQVGLAIIHQQDADEMWQPAAALVAGDAGASDRLATSVAIRGDTIALGAPFDNNAGGADAGAVYLYRLRASLDAQFADCNDNGRDDLVDIAQGPSSDINDNLIPDECESPRPCPGDFNQDGVTNSQDFFEYLSVFFFCS